MQFPARSYVFVAVLLTAIVAPARGDNWVDCEFGDDLNLGTEASPYKTIQFGVDVALPGDTVWVKAGTCLAIEQPFPVRMNPGISVVGAGNQSTFVRNADAGADFAAFYFGIDGAVFDTDQRISDLHIRTDSDGIQIVNGSPTISNNVIRKGTSGITINTLYSYVTSYDNAANPIIENNVFYDAITSIDVQELSAPINAVIRNNWILGNQTGVPTDVNIHMVRLGNDDLSPIIENNVLANAQTGIIMRGGRPTIVNNTIVNHDYGISFYYQGAFQVIPKAFNNNLIAYNIQGVDETFGDAAPVEMKNNAFFANSYLDYFDDVIGPVFDLNTLPAASGNVSGLRPGFVDPVGDDWHLLPGSPMINRGTASMAPADDIDTQARVGAPDIGADEFSGFAGFPNLIVTGHAVASDRCPGATPPGSDGDIDPGEVVDVTLTITNLSPFAGATEVLATVVADGPSVLPVSAVVEFGTVPALATVSSVGVYSFRYTPSPLACAARVRFFIDFSTAETGPLPRGVFELPVGALTGCQLCSAPIWPLPTDLLLPSSSLIDLCSKASPPGMNLAIEPGEDGELTFTVRNNSAVARASSVELHITTTTPGVTPSSATILVGSIAPSASVVTTEPFQFTLASSVSCGSTVDFDVAIDWLELAPSPRPVFPVSLPVPGGCVDCRTAAPVFALAAPAVAVTDSCAIASPGAGDGRIDRGEHLDLVVSLRNTAAFGGATNVTAKLYSLGTLATPAVADVVFGPIGPGATAVSSAAPITVSTAATCGAELRFELEVRSDQTGVVTPRLPFSLFVASGCALCGAQPPVLTVTAPTFTDRCEFDTTGGDGTINPGESIDFALNVTNSSTDVTATGVTAAITFDEFWLGPPAATVSFPDVAPLSVSMSNQTTLQIVRSGYICADDFTVFVTFSTNETGPLPVQQFAVDVDCPVCEGAQTDLTAAARVVTGRCPYGPPGGDGKLDAGEMIDIVLDVQNLDTLGTATGVAAIFSTADPGIYPSVVRAVGPDIAALATERLEPASFYVDPTTPCGTVFNFEYLLSSIESGFESYDTFTLTVDLGCEICQTAPSGLLLFRTTVLDRSVGWKQAIPLPLDSASIVDPGWPRSVIRPGSQEDLGALDSPWPVTLYRVVSDLDGDQGNVLRLVKSGTGVRISY